jgi:hypothetical protein
MKRLVTCIAGVALFSLPRAAGAQAIVVSAKGAIAGRLQAGAGLKVAQPIVLAAGDVLVVVYAGGTRRLVGPGHFALDKPSPLALQQLSVSFQNSDQPAVAGLRRMAPAHAPAPPAPNIWYANVASGGRFCAPSDGPVTFWRADSASEASIVAAGAAPLAWPAGHATLELPASFPSADGTSYTVNGASATVSRIELHRIDAATPDARALVGALDKAGCAKQLMMLKPILLP